ncbi:unnamed protein product [Bemisia tabaci]|uniref:Methyltransferase HEMK2 n=1 Tax=Bemisia tabaci TaxID=7038 RepID=A0A9P0ABA1_BEMTA|nr:unnamed protein product [Bemisia tabaci]
MSISVPKLATPDWSSDLSENVYEPSEDSFLLLDALESDLHFIQEKIQPLVLLEVGSGSGVIITALSKFLAARSFCMAVDINWDACVATCETARINDAQVDVIQMDLDSALCLNNQVDLLVFNPPYVVTPDEEIESGGIVASWAGGKTGRQVLDRLLGNLSYLLSKNSVGYFVVIEENQPEAIKVEITICWFYRGKQLRNVKFATRLYPFCVSNLCYSFISCLVSNVL